MTVKAQKHQKPFEGWRDVITLDPAIGIFFYEFFALYICMDIINIRLFCKELKTGQD